MANTSLYDKDGHKNILLADFDKGGLAVQSNQHIIIHGNEGMILDPGGHKIYTKVLSETTSVLGEASLKYLFLSHQDPDIIAAINGWLMMTDADAYISGIWVRFVPHFGLDRLVADRLKPIPDEGMKLSLAGQDFYAIPAHFLHSTGNFHLLDPVSKILYTGDLGASLGQDYIEVPDFDAHIQYMEGFHRRYMASTSALRTWSKLARQLDVETIAPQHGALFKGKEMVGKFLDWCDTLECGIDVIQDCYKVPA